MDKLAKHDLRLMWNKSTSELPYGVQAVFVDILDRVKKGEKTDLVYGADYRPKGACLVNAAGNMLQSGGGKGIPITYFHDVVSTFDAINRMFETEGVNTEDGFVSPLAGEILLQWFGELKPVPDFKAVDEAKVIAFVNNIPYTEPTDEELAESFEQMLVNPPVPEPVKLEVTPFDHLDTHDNEDQDDFDYAMHSKSSDETPFD